MKNTLALNVVAAIVAFSLADAPVVKAQYATVVEITTPERRIPPPPEVRGYEHRANNPYFGLRSSYSSIRQYYSNPVKTIPQRTTRVIRYYGGGNFRGFPVYPHQVYPRYSYGYGYPRGFRRW